MTAQPPAGDPGSDCFAKSKDVPILGRRHAGAKRVLRIVRWPPHSPYLRAGFHPPPHSPNNADGMVRFVSPGLGLYGDGGFREFRGTDKDHTHHHPQLGVGITGFRLEMFGILRAEGK